MGFVYDLRIWTYFRLQIFIVPGYLWRFSYSVILETIVFVVCSVDIIINNIIIIIIVIYLFSLFVFMTTMHI